VEAAPAPSASGEDETAGHAQPIAAH
jgi:hypothetical protein